MITINSIEEGTEKPIGLILGNGYPIIGGIVGGPIHKRVLKLIMLTVGLGDVVVGDINSEL